MSLRCQDLRELGVAALGPRRRLMAAAASAATQCAERCPRSVNGSRAQGHGAPGGAGAEKLHPVMAAARRGARATPSPARRASLVSPILLATRNPKNCCIGRGSKLP